MTRTADPGVGEAAMVLVRQLCTQEANAAKFLSQDAMQQALHVLDDTAKPYLHEVAAQVVGKVRELWSVTYSDLEAIDLLLNYELYTIAISVRNPYAYISQYRSA